MDLFERGNTLLGRYVLKGKIDAGGMGEVYLAHDKVLDRSVAIKRVKIDGELAPDQTQSFLKRFRQEAQAVAKLRHPSIVTIHDVQEVEQSPFIVMEYFEDGAPLVAWGKRTSPTIPHWLALAKQIFLALDHAHSRGILHRDIKSGNVLARGSAEAPEILLVDWGIALNEALQRVTTVGQHVGTPGATDPAVLRGGEWTRQSDYFAVGVLLYRCLCGRKPHDVPENTPPINLGPIYAENKIIPPHKANPAVDNDVQTFLVRLLATDPSGRPPSALAALAMIDALMKGEDVDFDAIAAKYPAPPAPLAVKPAASVTPAEHEGEADSSNSLEQIMKLAAPPESRQAPPKDEEKPTKQEGKAPVVKQGGDKLDTSVMQGLDEQPIAGVARKSAEQVAGAGFSARVADFRPEEPQPKRKSAAVFYVGGAVLALLILGAAWLAKRNAAETRASTVANVEAGGLVVPSDLQHGNQQPGALDQLAAERKPPAGGDLQNLDPNTRAMYGTAGEPIGGTIPPPPGLRARRSSSDQRGEHDADKIDRSLRPPGVDDPADAKGQVLPVRYGTRVDVSLLETLDTSSADPVKAQLMHSLTVDSTHFIPAGSIFIGRASLRISGNYLRSEAHFEQVVYPDGSPHRILALAVKPDGSEGIAGGEFEYGDDGGGDNTASKAGQIAGNAVIDGVSALPGVNALSGTLLNAANETSNVTQSKDARPRKKNRLIVGKGSTLTLQFQATTK